jgi:hypothetical protein
MIHNFCSENNGHTVFELEADRKKLLLAEEERWRHKSRAIWIKSGDKNTKLFHRFASYRRNKKYIWEIKDDTGAYIRGNKTSRKKQ